MTPEGRQGRAAAIKKWSAYLAELETLQHSHGIITLSELRGLLALLLVEAPHLHAAAPTGYKCSDCTIDGEACPTCYEASWRARHSHHASH